MNALTRNGSFEKSAHAERRRYQRFSVNIAATLLHGGAAQSTIINDLSAGGVGLKSAIGVFANDAVVIELEDGRQLEGSVAWWMSGCCGVQFFTPLDETDPLLLSAMAG